MSIRIRAFTLIELLVVISIIALLIALLLPALGQAKDAAKSAQCLSQQKQMVIAMHGYANDYEGLFPNFSHVPGEYWHHELAHYLGNEQYEQNADLYTRGGMMVMVCPMTTIDKTGMGSANTTWHFGADPATGRGGGLGSYGLNLWFMPTSAPVWPAQFADRLNLFYQNMDDVPQPSNSPMFGDSIWVGSWPGMRDLKPGNLILGNNTHANGQFMGRYTIERHGKGINVGMADSSVRHSMVGDPPDRGKNMGTGLWALNWSKEWSGEIAGRGRRGGGRR